MVDYLNKADVLTDTVLWIKKTSTDEHIYWLLVKFVKTIKELKSE